jgi:hypothetical protein
MIRGPILLSNRGLFLTLGYFFNCGMLVDKILMIELCNTYGCGSFRIDADRALSMFIFHLIDVLRVEIRR